MTSILDWLHSATNLLRKHDIDSARLDAEIILAHTLKKPRTWLHAHSDIPLDLRVEEIANARIDLRRDHTPIAYIIGHKEFYGRRFIVTPSVLIPSPETEALVELAASCKLPEGSSIIDVGTGCGAIGLTLKLEFPTLNVTLSDISEHALTIAKRNASQLHVDAITFQRSNLLDSWKPLDPRAPFIDMIIANLPYVDRAWERNNETSFEPELALFADNHGLKLIFRLIEQASLAVKPGGTLILEADPRQHDAIKDEAERHGFHLVRVLGYGLLLSK